MRVPLPTNEISGHVYADAVALLRPIIAESCGGTQCLTVAKKENGSPEDDLDEPCDRVDSAENTDFTDDGSGAGTVTVARGGTIYLLVNIPCEDRPTAVGSSETTPPGSGESPPTS